MSVTKIIFSGPVGAGKTTSITAVSDIEPFRTEEAATDDVKDRKDNTTVAMDYGMIKLDEGEIIHLYGTPGQDRFNFMWEILTEGGIGLVLMIDNNRPDPISDLNFFIDAFKEFINRTGVVIGISRMDLNRTTQIRDFHNCLKEHNIVAPVFEVDGRRPEDIAILVQALLYTLDPDLAA